MREEQRSTIGRILDAVDQSGIHYGTGFPMIARENVISPLVRQACDSDLHGRYAEGLPGKRIVVCCSKPRHLRCSGLNAIGFSNETDAEGEPGNGFQAALENRSWRMVSAHAIHGHPEAIGVIDGVVAIRLAALETPEGVKDKGLQHGACHRARTGNHRAGDTSCHRAGR